MAKKRKSKKGKMPAGLAAYWAKKRGTKKKARRKAAPKKRSYTRRQYGPTRRSLGRDVRAHHTSQIKAAKTMIADELKAMRKKLSLLGMGISGRAGRRK